MVKKRYLFRFPPLNKETQALTQQTTAETETEFHRKTYRAKELLMLYYANNPPNA